MISRVERERAFSYLREEGWTDDKIAQFLEYITENENKRQIEAIKRLKAEFPEFYHPESLLGIDIEGFVSTLDSFY